MSRWLLLRLGLLAVAFANPTLPEGISDAIGPDNFSLTELLTEALSKPSFNQCKADVLAGGFISMSNRTDILQDNYTVSTPYLFITCPNDSKATQNDSLMLKNLALALNGPSVVYDIDQVLSKDNFENSILMITFTKCAVCIGTWMVYLVWILLPSKTSFSKSFLVPIYILFSAIYDTAMLRKGVKDILEKQYRLNIQDSSEYESHIINGVAHKVGALICNAMANVNWTALIYYMFHDNKRIKVGWLPFTVANRNRLIVAAGLGLTLIDTGLLAGLQWHPTRPLWISFKVFEFTIYTLFCGSTAFYIWRDFRFILAPQRKSSTSKIPVMTILRLIWNDYNETIPLLFYNINLFVLLYFTTIYLTIDFSPTHRWQFGVIGFMRLIVTVSVWGLINVLERRELIISKETVLGRKIYNDDEYFFDPKLSSQYRSVDTDGSGGLSRSASGENVHSNVDIGHRKRSIYSPLKYPAKVWRSQMERSKNIRANSRGRRNRFIDTFIGKCASTESARKHPAGEINEISSPTLQLGMHENERSSNDLNRESALNTASECATVETTLARNYIYGYSDGE